MIHRAAIVKAIKGKPRDQQLAFLFALKDPKTNQPIFNQQQAEDFIDDYEYRSAKVEKSLQSNNGKFSQSETFKQMVEGFRERIFGGNK
jgi:hypothetical protein